jgi:hypothetical protein
MGYSAAIIPLGSGVMRTLAPPWDGCGMNDFSMARDVVAVSCVDGDVSRVTFYRTALEEHAHGRF